MRDGSWVVIDRQTGKAVVELFSRRAAEAVDQCKYEVKTALEYLQDFNRALLGARQAEFFEEKSKT